MGRHHLSALRPNESLFSVRRADGLFSSNATASVRCCCSVSQTKSLRHKRCSCLTRHKGWQRPFFLQCESGAPRPFHHNNKPSYRYLSTYVIFCDGFYVVLCCFKQLRAHYYLASYVFVDDVCRKRLQLGHRIITLQCEDGWMDMVYNPSSSKSGFRCRLDDPVFNHHNANTHPYVQPRVACNTRTHTA